MVYEKNLEKTCALLDQIRILSKKRKELKEERASRGDNFNLFQDLGLISDEVRLHSSIIATLLNPRGSHGQKDKYLKAFIEMICEIDKRMSNDFLDTGNPKMSVQVEKTIGPLTNEKGGRIDLYITDTNHRIIIENKIYAGDQYRQMKRYWNYGIEKGGEGSFKLIYLTLWGNSPSEESLGGLNGNQYLCLSYKHDIMAWLEKCLQLSVAQPLVRETIVQYINTIKLLTNSNMNKNDEIMQILCKTDYIDAAFDIFNSRDEFFNYVINTRFIPQLKVLAKEKGLVLKTDTTDWIGTSWAGGCFYKEGWKYFKLAFEFEKRGLGDLIFGFLKRSKYERPEIGSWEELQERFQSRDRGNQMWIWKYFEGYTYWNDKNVIKDLLDENSRTIADFASMIDYALACAEGLEL